MDTKIIDHSHQSVLLIGDIELSISNMISVGGLFATLIGLGFVVWQLRQIALQSQFSVLQTRYKLIF